MAKRRKPSPRHERLDLVGIKLIAYFAGRPKNEADLIRPLIEDIRGMAGDPEARERRRSE